MRLTLPEITFVLFFLFFFVFFTTEVVIGCINTGMVDFFRGLLMSLMVLQLVLVDRKLYLPCLVIFFFIYSVKMTQRFSSVQYFLLPYIKIISMF